MTIKDSLNLAESDVHVYLYIIQHSRLINKYLVFSVYFYHRQDQVMEEVLAIKRLHQQQYHQLR